MFDWAQYQTGKGAVKIHMVLSHDGYLPQYAVVTDGKKSDIEIAKTFSFEPGTMLVFDRGYADYGWWLNLSRGKVNFVTRLKDCAAYTIIEQRPVNPTVLRIIRDEVILLDEQKDIGPIAKLRRIEVLSDDGKDTVVFVTNNLTLAPTTIAGIYRERWKIELFFKAIKQSLRIRTFVGTSENAVKVQIWTAMIAMLLIKLMRLRASYNWCLSNLVALLRQQLFVYRPMQACLDNPLESRPRR
jgi:IS4 transposase